METCTANEVEQLIPGLVKNIEFKRAKLECLRNMATMTAYTFGASYLTHQRPRIWGSHVPSVVIGSLLFLVAIWGTISAAELFLDASMRHYSVLRFGKRDTVFSRALFVFVLMLSFCILLIAPYIVFYGLPPK